MIKVKVEVPSKKKIQLCASELQEGTLAIIVDNGPFSGHVGYRTFKTFVNLNRAGTTWGMPHIPKHGIGPEVEILPLGTKVILEVT